MKKTSPWIVVIFLLVAMAVVFFSLEILKNYNPVVPMLTINNRVIKLEVAKTPQQWRRGLSGRDGLCDDCGMLFVFPEKSIKQFWMKDMRFSIDIIWLNDDRVVGVSANLPAPIIGELPAVVSSPELTNYVLELPAGFASKYSLINGSMVKYGFNIDKNR